MQFSLRTLMVAALLTGLLASALAMRFQLVEFKANAVEMESQIKELNGWTYMPAFNPHFEESCQRVFDSIEKRSSELKRANAKYLTLAESKNKLKIVDRTKFSIIQIPDTSWDRPEVSRIGWRIFVPESTLGTGSLHLAFDFLPQRKNSIGIYEGELKHRMKESSYFNPATPGILELPIGESNLYFETTKDSQSKIHTVRLLSNETCIHELQLIEICDGMSSSSQTSEKQKEIDIEKPISLIRWTPSLPNADGSETLLLRIVAIQSSLVEESN